MAADKHRARLEEGAAHMQRDIQEADKWPTLTQEVRWLQKRAKSALSGPAVLDVRHRTTPCLERRAEQCQGRVQVGFARPLHRPADRQRQRYVVPIDLHQTAAAVAALTLSQTALRYGGRSAAERVLEACYNFESRLKWDGSTCTG